MLGENIRNLRKQKGYSQEAMAEQLHVVRQTVSKWEKGISVPDAEMLNQISELFDTPVNILLGSKIPEQEEKSDISEVSKQLAILNNQLANQVVRRRNAIKRAVVGIVIAGMIILTMYIACAWITRYLDRKDRILTTTNLECTLNGETYLYGVTYDEQFRVIQAGGDAWIADHVQTEQYDDANILIAQIEDYFTDRDGTCKIIEETREN